MNLPSILILILVLAVFSAIIARGIYNRKHGKSSCSCGDACGSCCKCNNKK